MNKKSLLVAPALGVLLLAAAGSVGGTVAWFSSVSSVQANVTSFKAYAIDGNLSVTGGYVGNSAGYGISSVDNATSIPEITMDSGNRMTHASYDHINDMLFTRSSEGDNGTRDVTEAGNWIAKANYDGTGVGQGHNVYWAVKWTLTFTYSWASEDAVNLYFDPASNVVNNTTHDDYNREKVGGYAVGDIVRHGDVLYRCNTAIAANSEDWTPAHWTAAEDTVKGLRIAFIGEAYAESSPGVQTSTTTAGTTANKRVWSKHRAGDAGDATQPHHIKDGEGAANPDYYLTGTEYSDPYLIDTDFRTQKRTEGVAIEADDSWLEVDCLAQLKRDSAKTSVVKFTCVAWFEGTDPSIVDSAVLEDAIDADLKFYTREAKGDAINS